MIKYDIPIQPFSHNQANLNNVINVIKFYLSLRCIETSGVNKPN